MVRMQPPEYFEEVRDYASDLWTNKQRAGERNSNKMLLQQISDIRYVISELLQNADDAGATSASVKIDANQFVFEHNGRDFSKEDFRALCSFAVSNKTTCQTIGFRGIGFKAIFSIGNQVYVRTPTLSVYFLRKRYTEPIWDDTDYPHRLEGLTRITVGIENEFVENGLKESFDEWIKSNYSLLFFKHLKEIKIGRYAFKISDIRSGPVKNSVYLTMDSALGSSINVLKISSNPLPPPLDVVEEVRDIRNMEESDNQEDVPPFVIDIILGIPKTQSLYVVLPTLTRTDLKISMNAPFVLTPDRKTTKHPGQSPTNRWLLEEVGNLIVGSLKEWLGNTSLSISERVDAYKLLQPTDVTEYGDKLVNKAISTYLSKTNIVLDLNGSFQSRCLSIPEGLYSVWDKKVLFGFFKDAGLPIIEKVANKYFSILKAWDLAEKADDAKFLSCLLAPAKIPRPQTTKQLILLWECVGKAHTAAYNYSIKHRNEESIFRDENIKNYQIFPIQNEQYLQPAEDTMDTMRICHDLDESVPQRYRDLVSTKIRFIDPVVDEEIQSSIDDLPTVVSNLLENTVKLESPTIKELLDALSAFEMDEDADIITLAHMYMHWDEEVPEDYFEYIVSSGNRIRINDGAVYYDKKDILTKILPVNESASKILSPLYEKQLDSAEEKEKWTSWVLSEKSHIIQPLKLIEEYGDFSLQDELVVDIDAYYKSNPKGKEVWADCLLLILETDENYYQKINTRNGRVAEWVDVFKDKPCIYGDDGNVHLPNEVYWKNDVTELLEDELFIDARYLDVTEKLLKELGVQYTPGYPEALIQKLKALSSKKSKDLAIILDCYTKLDKIVDHVKQKKSILEKIRGDFQTYNVVYTDRETWATSRSVYRNETVIPYTYCLHPDVVHLILWNTLQFSPKPSLEDYMNYLRFLKKNEIPSTGELVFIKKLLSSHPEDVLQKVGCWLSIDNHWKAADSFDYYILDKKGIPGLYSKFKAKIPQLSLIKKEQRTRLCAAYFGQAIDIVNESVWNAADIEVNTQVSPISFTWMVSIGQFFVNNVPETHPDYAILQDLGDLFINTKFLWTNSFNVAPYYHGERIGIGKAGRIKWENEKIYCHPSLKKDEVGIEFGDLIDQNPLVEKLEDETLVKTLHYLIDRDSVINKALTRHFKVESEEDDETDSQLNDCLPTWDEEPEEYDDDSSDEEMESQEEVLQDSHPRRRSTGGSLGDSIKRKTHDGSPWPKEDEDSDEDEYDEPDTFDPEKYEENIEKAQRDGEDEYLNNYDDEDEDIPYTDDESSNDDWEVGDENDTTFYPSTSDSSSRGNNCKPQVHISHSVRSFKIYAKSNDEEKAFLRSLYPNGACQICGTKIKTKKGNIFWARNILHDVPDEMKATENLGWNSLALCPNCATRWRYSGALPEDFKEKISEYELSGSEKRIPVDIYIQGEKTQVFFAPRHFARLQAVMLARLKREEEGEYDQ